MKDLVREYMLPTRIVEKSDNVKNAEVLLYNTSKQNFFKDNSFLEIHGQGYIILDFGREVSGGIRILSNYFEGQKFPAHIRIRFGESVGEACAEPEEKNAGNYHSVRDMAVELPDMSDTEWGQTGFRFVRIDFLTPNKTYRLVNVYAVYTHRDLVYRGDFKCDDELVNDIYDTAKYTLFLNMQSQLWDGVKRDRLVWIGDMQPEVLGITYLFGSDECVEPAIKMSIEKNPLPSWFGNIATYSFWLIQILFEYYIKTKNSQFVLDNLGYVDGILSQLDACVLQNGKIDLNLSDAESRGYFLDWATFRTDDAEAGNRYVFIYTIRNLKKLYKMLHVAENPLCDSLLNRLIKVKDSEKITAKQVVALGYLSGQIDKEEASAKLTINGAKGVSTHMSYFIFKALVESSGVDVSIDIMKEYYGGMLSRGATSFWESFNVEWLENSGRIDERTPNGLKDLHGDYGEFCYVGYRHSLCHGWSCGPVQFLSEDVLGINVIDAGCKTIVLKPNLGKLKWVNGKFPTPYGVMEINHKKVKDKVYTKYWAPKEINVVLDEEFCCQDNCV